MLVTILLLSIDIACFDRGFYQRQYQLSSTANVIEISTEDLTNVTNVLLDYLQDKRDNLDIEVAIANQLLPFFNQKEIDHMVDVKVLYMNVRMWLIICGLIGTLGLVLTGKRYRDWWKACQRALLVFGAVLSAIAVFALFDFQSFWTQFHLLIFSNDLWLLNPMTDRLIMLVPESFFYSLVIKIFTYTFIGLMIYIVSIFMVRKRD